jgi:gas vesicle protein
MGLFGKKKETNVKQPKSVIDKIVMGAIIGTAIGSVVGLSMAPKSGKETREFLKEQYEAHKDLEDVKKLTKETVSGFGSLVKNLIFGKSKKSTDAPRDRRPLREIPNEGEAVTSGEVKDERGA